MREPSVRHVVALGGSVGTGKALALRILRQLGYEAIDADQLAHELTLKGTPGYQQILARVGAAVLDGSGWIDSSKVYQASRTDPSVKERMRGVVAPLIRHELAQRIRKSRAPLVFIKTGSLDADYIRELCDRVWLLEASPQVCFQNLMDEHGWTRALAEGYVRSHAHAHPRAVAPDLVIENSGARRDFWMRIAEAARELESGSVLQPVSAQTLAPSALEDLAGALPRAAPRSERPRLIPDMVVTPAAPEEAVRRQATPVAETIAKPVAARGRARPKVAPLAKPKRETVGRAELRLLGSRLWSTALTLLAIAYLTSWGLILAEHGREHTPMLPLQAGVEALGRTLQYVVQHPPSYFRFGELVPWLSVVSTTLGNSAGLLLLSMAVALLVGLPLGIAAAAARSRTSSALMILASLLGVSTASFLVAMMLWVVNIWVHRTFDIQVLPSAGFGWDAHVVMPVIVLAMRPLAQLAQVSYVTMREILNQDYIRTAYSKGLNWRSVRDRHAIPNIMIPILNTLGSSLRFSLASLPVVEVFFDWPGVGATLLDAIYGGSTELVIDLILSLGLFFLFVNLLIEFSFPLIDPRLRRGPESESRADRQGLAGQLRDFGNALAAMAEGLFGRFRRRRAALPALASSGPLVKADEDLPRPSRAKWLLGNFFRNPALIIGLVILVAMLALAAFGERLTPVSPYESSGIRLVEGVISAPPFKPSATFPWGTDHLGRDMRALVLAGARRTLSLAFFGMVARLALGTVLGLLAGWQRGGWFDRLVTGATGIWAAFPVTLFAMIVIQALGIQQGMWVFVVAISIVGWGEVAQFVRGQVVSLKPQAFIESARAVGARGDQILGRHIVPNLVNTLIVLAALEMAGVLMLLAELGFLNIFMGGGFRAMIGEAGRMMPVIAFYSDVPEWAALIANVRQYWRTYPWMALYPGLAVFISIMGFNLLGEGLRRFLEDSQVNLSRLFNRYTFVAALSVGGIAAAVVQSAGPLSVYRAEGLKFDEQRVMQDIAVLSAPEMQGRETGTAGAELAAIYIAQRMEQIGVFPAGQHNDYYQRLVTPRLHLTEMPTLALQDASGAASKEYVYKRDFSEVAQAFQGRGTTAAPVMGVAFGPVLDETSTGTAGFSNSAAMDHAIILRTGDLPKISTRQISAVLVIADESLPLERHDVYPFFLLRSEERRPLLVISPEVADELLRSAGSSLAELDGKRAALGPGELSLTNEGATVSMSVEPETAEDYLHEEYINVLGVIPGQGHFVGVEDQVIVVGAYYDGVGVDPAGTVYAGANDNASGVAVMLELARLLKESTYQPDKTIVFAAWAGGERQEGLSVANIMNARPGAQELTVETVLELSGVGYGTGSAISIGEESSYRVVNLFQEAAARYDVPTTTRGRGPHYDLPVVSVFGGREAMTLALSWAGSDHLAHTAGDVPANIVPEHLRDVGRTALLTLFVLSRETDY